MSTAFLDELFAKYYESAKTLEKQGNLASAKKYYILASETMLKISKETPTENLKQAKIAKAKKLLEIAESLSGGDKPRKHPTNSSGNNSKPQSQDNEDGKSWKAAGPSKIKFEDIAGLDDVKETIRIKMINPYLYPEKYQLFKKNSGGGVLLYGPPGCGKTMIAKAIAGEVNASFYAVKSSDIVSKWVGDSEKNIASLFETASKDERAIIFIDEMDSLFAQRGDDKQNDKRVNEFLQQIDGFSGQNHNLLILGATNRPWDIDDAAVRSGRFSTKIYVHLPDKVARQYLFERSLKDIPLEEDVNIDELALMTDYFSGADIIEAIDRAKDRALNESISGNETARISMEDLKQAIEGMMKQINVAKLDRFEKYAKTGK